MIGDNLDSVLIEGVSVGGYICSSDCLLFTLESTRHGEGRTRSVHLWIRLASETAPGVDLSSLAASLVPGRGVRVLGAIEDLGPGFGIGIEAERVELRPQAKGEGK